MTSIRRTLILNVTALLVVALGATAALVYRITQAAIEHKHQSASDLVRLQFEEKRDLELLAQARLLASDAQTVFDPAKFYQYNLARTLSLALPMASHSHVTTPLWLAESYPERFPGSLSFRLNMLLATELKLNESEAMRDGYVQVNSNWGDIWKSTALSGPILPLDISKFAEQRIDWVMDDIELTPGMKARRVRMKAPLTRMRVVTQSPEVSPDRASLGIAGGLRRDPLRPERLAGPGFDPSRGGRSRPGMARGGSPPPNANLPTVYIQVAWDSVHAPARLHEMEEERDHDLQQLNDETHQALAQLTNRLIWIGGLTLAVVIAGGWFLVGAGLAPLKRLSEAVSRVSAKDFKLPIDSTKLPGEILPIAQRLTQTLQQLQATFAREKRASADMSHELRTPLAALTTTLEVALRKPRSSDDYRQTIEDSRQIARQMSGLVERMLMLASLDAGADQVRPRAVDVDEIVDGCAAIGKPLAEAQGLRFQVKAERPLTVQTDPDKLREVVMNLLHNAIEYNRPGGEVEISACSSTGGAGIVVEVRDTGIGIPTELHEKIFERFYRGDPSRNAVGVHAGLGLAIVKEYVDRLGGRLSIESAVGTGSRFRLELPNV